MAEIDFLKISIVTINYNNLEGLKQTVQSVLTQTYQSIEYIIIDGGSSDGSEVYIQEMSSHFDYWVSESDKGIYNAMNKGIEQSTGDYLFFLNSGDSLYSNEVIEKLVGFKPVEDIIYGNTNLANILGHDGVKIMPSYLHGDTILFRTLNHQSTFFKSSIFSKGRKYDESYKYLADWVLYNTVVLIEGGTYRHIDLTISNYDLSGQTSQDYSKEVMDSERLRFMIENASFFIPMLISNYKNLLNDFNLSTNSKYVRLALRFRQSVLKIKKMIIS